jgi:site-specific recombinase XerD
LELGTLHERFILERRYLRNVSPATITFYQSCFKALPLRPEHYKADLVLGVQALKARNVQPRSINDYIRGNKAFLRWCQEERIVKEPIKLSWLKEEQKVLATLSAEQVQRIIHWKPVGSNFMRAHAVCLTILDTGVRISECLNLSRPDLDFENMILRVLGKGNKHRLVPMSIELRKVLFRYCGKHEHQLAFSTRNGTRITTRNFQRDMKLMGKRLGLTGVRFSPHTLRHTFAVGYLRAGGNLFYLSKILGHTSVKTTERYLQSLGIEDLQKVHSSLSLLTKG